MTTHSYKSSKKDEYYTKPYAVEPLIKYIPIGSVIWCPFDKDTSNFVQVFHGCGFSVISSHIDTGQDFFTFEPEKYDIIISNPPYSLREPILNRLFSLKKPFAMLMNISGLFDSKVRYNLLSTNKFEIMTFDKRIDYESDNNLSTSVPFRSVYLCSRLLPTQFVFESLKLPCKR